MDNTKRIDAITSKIVELESQLRDAYRDLGRRDIAKIIDPKAPKTQVEQIEAGWSHVDRGLYWTLRDMKTESFVKHDTVKQCPHGSITDSGHDKCMARLNDYKEPEEAVPYQKVSFFQKVGNFFSNCLRRIFK